MVNVPVIRRLLNNLASYINDLRSADDITFEKFHLDIRSQRFVERTLQIAIECCLDIVHHIISDECFREPTSFADAFDVLAEHNVLPMESIKEYQLMAQFRNKVVHYYEKIDPQQVYGIAKGKLETFDLFISQIESWLNTETPS
jgi:uncharacterized protein YutE (UPF0331/DUF86 family)